jgi:3-phenylpropionate/cinnamic acid dioxygenase small subunit
MNAVSTAGAKSAEHRAANVRVPVGSPEYNELLEFLYDEAALLDQRRINDWAQLLTEDIYYSAPIRQTRSSTDRHADINRAMQHFADDYSSLMSRIGRLNGKTAWAEDPPSRTRRFITNVRVSTTDKADEYQVFSYILLSRSRGEDSVLTFLSAERNDLIRRVTGGFKIARREIIVDQAVLGQANLAVFL